MASKILGFKWETSYRFDDNEMDSYPLLDIIKKIEQQNLKLILILYILIVLRT